MRVALLMLALMMLAIDANGAEPRRDGPRDRRRSPELFIEVPLDPHSTDVVFPFGGSHHAVPGAVTIDRAPYYCVKHAEAFRARAAFVEHLRSVHGVAAAAIPAEVVVDRGQQVRYVGE